MVEGPLEQMWHNSNNIATVKYDKHSWNRQRKKLNTCTASLDQISSVLYSNTNSDLTIGLPTKHSIKKTPVLLHQYSCLHQYPWGNRTSLMKGASIDLGISGVRVPRRSAIMEAALSRRSVVYWWIRSYYERGKYLIQSIDNAFLFISLRHILLNNF